ncbi:MAG: hypothetical protein HFI64_09460 [Lachnospiraceae bacterium]|nr:hypothetical protein [Lachnospiraceae bacterium]
MLSSISAMNPYYSMYRYGSASAISPVRRVQRHPVQDTEKVSAPQAEKSVSGTTPASASSVSRPALSWGGRLFLTAPAADPKAAEGASASGLLQMGTSPEELAVRMRIQYPDQATNGSGFPAASGSPEELPGLSKQQGDVPGGTALEKLDGSEECQTCKQRKYQDGSDDMGVSFKTPTHVAPEAAASAVRGHEQEHVVREQAKAEREDRRVVSQDVTLHTGICPECGKVYISGGTTRTVTAAESEPQTEGVAANDSGQEPVGRQPFLAVA